MDCGGDLGEYLEPAIAKEPHSVEPRVGVSIRLDRRLEVKEVPLAMGTRCRGGVLSLFVVIVLRPAFLRN